MDFYCILYLGICFLVGTVGINRHIGYWGTVLISFFLSPLMGIIISLLSHKKEISQTKIVVENRTSIASKSNIELIKEYQELKNIGAITEEEFTKIKSKLLR